MLNYIDIDEEYRDEEISTERYSAENQCWDKDTLDQLWNEYHICYDGRGVTPIKVADRGDGSPLIVIGCEDDGTIYFEKSYGQYRHSLSAYWIDSVIKQLQDVKKRLG